MWHMCKLILRSPIRTCVQSVIAKDKDPGSTLALASAIGAAPPHTVCYTRVHETRPPGGGIAKHTVATGFEIDNGTLPATRREAARQHRHTPI